jgi:glycosyltransferase involved in cell wall biosynthesis
MLGANGNHVTIQGEILAQRFADAGFPVHVVSTSTNRCVRFTDIVGTMIRRRKQIDVLMLQVFGGPSFVVEDAASRLGKAFDHRVVMHLHGGAMPQFMARHPRWTHRVLSRADILVTPSRFLAEAVARHGFSAKIIPNVVDLPAYPFRVRRHAKPRLLWMRTFHPLYNPRMALRVLSRVRAAVPHATLVMAGQDKGMEESLRGEASRLGLADVVRFPGFLCHERKVEEADAADIFINTNHVDNTPVGVVEAAAFGLPVVATAVGGVPHLLTHSQDGLLVPDDDDAAMASAVCTLVRDPQLTERLSTNGRRLAERSDWSRVRPHWEATLDALRT